MKNINFETPPNKSMIHELNGTGVKTKISSGFSMVVIVLAIVFGVGTGFLISNFTNDDTNSGSTLQNSSATTKDSKSAGVLDKKTFKDQAEGELKLGGLDGEGNFHLERPGGVSQNVYLTSTSVDLSVFVGKKVRVYGQTFSASKAGWLMDVGYIEII